MILDTNVLIDIMRNNKEAVSKAKKIADKEEPLFITTITVFELWQGFNPEKKQKYEELKELISSFGLFLLDIESAEISGKARKELSSKGLIVSPEDCMIAGIAIKNNQVLLTKDRHFSRIPGLKTEVY